MNESSRSDEPSQTTPGRPKDSSSRQQKVDHQQTPPGSEESSEGQASQNPKDKPTRAA